MRKFILLFFVFLLGLIAALFVFANPIVNNFLSKKLNTELKNNITITTGKYVLDVYEGNLRIENINFYQSSDSLKENKNLQVSIDKIQLTNIDVLSLVISKKLKCDSLFIENPKFDLNYFIKDSTKKKRSILKELFVRNIYVKNAHILHNNQVLGSVLKCENLNLYTRNLTIPIDSNIILAEILYDAIELQTSSFLFSSKSKMYAYEVDSIFVSTKKQGIKLNDFKIIPLYSKEAFAKVLGREAARIDFYAPEIELVDVNIEAFLLYDSLLIKKIVANNFKLEVFKDKRLPRPENLPEKLLPNEMIRNSKSPIRIDVIESRSSDILFEGKTKLSNETGRIRLSKINLQVSNVCNILNSTGGMDDLKIDFSALLENQGKLKATFSLPLMDVNKPMKLNGTLSKMDLKRFNAILMPFLSMKIKSGTLNKMTFNVKAFPNNSIGTLKMHYNDLNVSVRRIRDKEILEDSRLEWVVNLLINSFLIKKDNPIRKKELRTGQISFERDKTRFVVHYWLNSIFSGIPESLGISEKVREKVNN